MEATSKQHDNTQVDTAAAQRAKRKNVHIVFAKTYFSQGAFRFTAKSGFRRGGFSGSWGVTQRNSDRGESLKTHGVLM